MAPVVLLMCNVQDCKLENCKWVCGSTCVVAAQFADLAKQRRAHVPASWRMNVDICDLDGNEVLRLFYSGFRKTLETPFSTGSV